ncbi:efflux RND transporter permease subunit [Phreatobacter stygius]|uniref:Efflux RND transporter permease subunit n=1 Tax=Phreatobacter stygius TaxID=1940610 RepID=A0A4D7BH81_9HYPH|nr:efflux RND transporter permease subunit [Phreatobacter stygius]QCI69098.1 efflux RND transporter permease subunit [Phreatobacter stygius]
MSKGNWSYWAVTHPALVLFMILALVTGGAFSYFRLGRAEDPSFTIKVAVITAVWPGATAREMQDQVAERIEKKLQELPWFERVQTYTKPGFTAMQLVFRDNTPARDVPTLFYQTRKKLDDLRGELPAGLIGPNVNDEYGDVDSVLFTLTGDGASYAELKRIAERLKSRLLRVPNVTKVNLYGAQDERIFVEFSHAKLATLGVPASAIFESLQRQNAVVPAGTIDTGSARVPLRVTGALDGVAAVAATPVDVNGRIFRLGDIATITRGFVDPPTYLIRQEGQQALLVGVVMQKGANITTLGEDLARARDEFRRDIPVGIELGQIADQPKVVEHAISEFARSFVEALAIVLLVSFLSLGWRTGIVVALSVPMVLAVVFIAMFALGIDLHRISLGALIIALGLLVDDAIIAVEMMVVKMEQGWDRLSAAAYAWTSTAFPMLTGTLVTAIGFLPVGLANSSVGEYAGGIFWVVGLALMVSWFVAVVFTPYLGSKLLPDFHKLEQRKYERAVIRAAKRGKPAPPQPDHSDPHAIYDTRMYRGLRRAVGWSVDHKFFVVATTLVVFVGAVVAFGRVQQQFFPISERPELFFEMRLPQGTAITSSLETAKRAEAMLKGDPDITTYTTYVGQGSPRFWLGLNPQLPDESFAQIVIISKDLEARERIKTRLEAEVAGGKLSEARVRVDRFNFGPPVGFPVQFRVIGIEPQAVRDVAIKVRDIMRGNPNTRDPHLDWNEQSPSVKLVVDQDRARSLGLNVQDVAQTLQTLLSGVTVTSVRDRTERVDIVARAVGPERVDLGRIGDLTIIARGGVPVPLAQVARIEFEQEDPILWRRNRDLTMTVRSDVRDGIQPPVVSAQVQTALKDLIAALPAGMRIEQGGAVEESAKANTSIFILFPVMLLAMLSVLMLQLQSFSRLFLVFSTAPLGLIGASFGLNLTGAPFGFVALLGLIALAGMIMRNTVILVQQIDEDQASGYSLHDAIIEATVRRSRPVVLTALAAMLAMIPLARSLFFGPMAITIAAGLFGATILTLLFLPALYAVWFRVKPSHKQAAPAEPEAAEQLRLPMAAE